MARLFRNMLMGHVAAFDLDSLKRRYGLEVFIETGTGAGDSLQHALGLSFKELYSIEIMEPVYEAARRRFPGIPNCFLLNRPSKEGLAEVLPRIDSNRRILFWLDAHFPGADLGLAGYGDVANSAIRIPLEEELSVIQRIRKGAPDVLLIDDLRIYEDGPFHNGNWSDRARWGGQGIGFVHELFGQTHRVTRDFRSEGYLVLEPMGLENPS